MAQRAFILFCRPPDSKLRSSNNQDSRANKDNDSNPDFHLHRVHPDIHSRDALLYSVSRPKPFAFKVLPEWHDELLYLGPQVSVLSLSLTFAFKWKLIHLDSSSDRIECLSSIEPPWELF